MDMLEMKYFRTVCVMNVDSITTRVRNRYDSKIKVCMRVKRGVLKCFGHLECVCVRKR